MVRNTQYDAAWVYTNNPEIFSKSEALDLVSKNLEIMLGVNERAGVDAGAGAFAGVEGQFASEEKRKQEQGQAGWVAWEGDWTKFEGKVRAVKGPGAGKTVHVF